MKRALFKNMMKISDLINLKYHLVTCKSSVMMRIQVVRSREVQTGS